MKTLKQILQLAKTDEGKQQIRVMVAELCGWKVHPKDRFIVIPPNSPNSVQPIGTIPLYTTSLDAIMSEARKLNEDKRDDYLDNLEAVCGTDGWSIMSLEERWSITTAEAIHHCIALILTLQPNHKTA